MVLFSLILSFFSLQLVIITYNYCQSLHFSFHRFSYFFQSFLNHVRTFSFSVNDVIYWRKVFTISLNNHY